MTVLDHKFCASITELKMDNATGEVEGYASRFGQVDLGGDMVMPGAYKNSLATGKSIKMLWNHDPNFPIGVWDEVQEDDEGLKIKGRLLSGIAKAQETLLLIKAGAIDGLSIGYRTVNADRTVIDGKTVRQLKELDLWEISHVTFPMQPTARTFTRKSTDWQDPRFIEQYLREGGCSNNRAKAIASQSTKASHCEGDLGALDEAAIRAMTDAFSTA